MAIGQALPTIREPFSRAAGDCKVGMRCYEANFHVVGRCGTEIAWKLPVFRNVGAFCSFLPLGLVKVIGPV
jgi:hypothetical protein